MEYDLLDGTTESIYVLLKRPIFISLLLSWFCIIFWPSPMDGGRAFMYPG